ncbi:MAG: urease accessory protein UreF [Thalassobaculum sp.]|uniref:urease accessory protein UreF n=1 Tax=Thalassobaculum sp. TaxID=2022740 RepID=UPI0032EBE092
MPIITTMGMSMAAMAGASTTTAATTTIMARGRMTTTTIDPAGLLKLAAWLSPSFPVGAFAYSTGLEWAVEDGLVVGREGLATWLRTVVETGPPRQDAVLAARAWRAVAGADDAALVETAELAAVLKGTAELAQETVVQGAAYLRTVAAAWPDDRLDRVATALAGVEPALPVAVGAASAAHGVALAPTLRLFLHAVVANQVSAAIRLSVIGQTDGQRVTAALEPVILAVAAAAEAAGPDDLGAATPMLDWCSMRHETQHTRLFRS